MRDQDNRCYANRWSPTDARCSEVARWYTPEGVTIKDICAGWQWCDQHRRPTDLPIRAAEREASEAVSP